MEARYQADGLGELGIHACGGSRPLRLLRLRGPKGSGDKFHLATAAQNLRKLAELITEPAP